jgi:hypothetical protein
MAAIKIHSRLRHFNLLTRITRVYAEGMGAIADLHQRPVFCGLEAMAQLAALHVRHCVRFRSHAFLLKVIRGRWPLRDALQGCYRLTAERYSQSSNGFAYRVRAQGSEEGAQEIDLLIGTRPYDHQFRKDILEAHYRDLFERLRGDGSSDARGL